MGPRPFSRRDYIGDGGKRSDERALQWGRDLSVAETNRGSLYPRISRCHASMGPRPFSRRDVPLSHLPGRPAFSYASMGPRPFSRRDLRTHHEGLLTLLQWGRDLSVAETGRDSPCSSSPQRLAARYPRRMLQWGRDLSVAETCVCRSNRIDGPPDEPSFNGAATFQSQRPS